MNQSFPGPLRLEWTWKWRQPKVVSMAVHFDPVCTHFHLSNTKVWHPQPAKAFEWSLFLQVLCLQAVILIATDYLEVMNFNACPNYTSCKKGRDDTHQQCGLLRLGFSCEIPPVQDCPAHRTPYTWLPQNLAPTNKPSISIQSLGRRRRLTLFKVCKSTIWYISFLIGEVKRHNTDVPNEILT